MRFRGPSLGPTHSPLAPLTTALPAGDCMRDGRRDHVFDQPRRAMVEVWKTRRVSRVFGGTGCRRLAGVDLAILVTKASPPCRRACLGELRHDCSEVVLDRVSVMSRRCDTVATSSVSARPVPRIEEAVIRSTRASARPSRPQRERCTYRPTRRRCSWDGAWRPEGSPRCGVATGRRRSRIRGRRRGGRSTRDLPRRMAHPPPFDLHRRPNATLRLFDDPNEWLQAPRTNWLGTGGDRTSSCAGSAAHR